MLHRKSRGRHQGKEGQTENRPAFGQTLANLLKKLNDQSTYCGMRDYALICLSIDTAIRPSEALALNVDDVNLKRNDCAGQGINRKDEKSRTLTPSSIETAKAITGVNNRKAEGIKNTAALLPTTKETG